MWFLYALNLPKQIAALQIAKKFLELFFQQYEWNVIINFFVKLN